MVFVEVIKALFCHPNQVRVASDHLCERPAHVTCQMLAVR